MYELKGKETEAKRQDSGLRRGHTPNIQRRAEQRKPNQTGLPDTLKLGIENLSGISMDDVRVHYNSSKPAQLQALAYTKGTDIHIAPGQTKHLPHEAWHVVQQKQGRVMPTMRFGGDLINDNPALEREADCMGAKAVQGKFKDDAVSVKNITCCCVQRQMPKAAFFEGSYSVQKYYRNGKTFVSRGSTMAMITPLQANDKTDALQQISAEAARIGNIAKASGMVDSEFFYAVIQAKYKTNTQREIDMYKSQIEELDDNIYAEPYMKDIYREVWEEEKRKLEDKHKKIAPVTLSLEYQFRKSGVGLAKNEAGGPGYIVSVKKTRQGGGFVTGEINGDDVDPTAFYSNIHEPTQGSILEDTYKRSNAGDQRRNIMSKNFDAYTKLAGEGARFQCVRRNIATIKDDTVIHVRGAVKGVKFSELWRTWSASFGKKYDIPDEEIRERLKEKSVKNGKRKKKNTLWINPDRYTEPVPVDRSNHIELEEND